MASYLSKWIMVIIALILSACSMNTASTGEPPTATPQVIIEPATATSSGVVLNPTVDPSPTTPPTATTASSGNPPISGGVCQHPGGWIPYTIGPGDTLGGIATRTNTTVQALTDGNCLTNANLINVGQQIYIPAVNTNTRPLPVGSIGFEGAQMEISPIINTGAGFVDVQANAPIALHWSTIPTGSVRVDFMVYAAGGSTPQTVMATDSNLADGASGTWQVPASLDAVMYAIGFGSDGNWIGFSDHRRVIASAPVAANCVPRTYWQTYTVSVGVTLEQLALAGNISIQQILSGNCWTSINAFGSGITMRVPALPAACVPNDMWQTYTVRAGDQLDYLAVVGGIGVSDVLRGNCWFDSTPFVTGATMRLPVLPYVPPVTAIDSSRCMHNSPGTFAPMIEPVLAVDLTLQCFELQQGSRVRITLSNLPTNTHTVEFLWSVPGPNPFTIGTTTDVSTGTATIMWDVPNNQFMGQIYAYVYRVDGGLLESNTIGVYAG